MNIKQIDADRILISLCDEDLKSYCITFESLDTDDRHSELVLEELLLKASEYTGTSFRNKRVLIEAMKYDHGCILLLTLREKAGKRRSYRLSRTTQTVTFAFDRAESFLCCIEALYHIKNRRIVSSAFVCGNRYYLVISSPAAIKSSLLNTASEFSCEKKKGLAFISFLREHGEALSVGRAVEIIGKELCKASGSRL